MRGTHCLWAGDSRTLQAPSCSSGLQEISGFEELPRHPGTSRHCWGRHAAGGSACGRCKMYEAKSQASRSLQQAQLVPCGPNADAAGNGKLRPLQWPSALPACSMHPRCSCAGCYVQSTKDVESKIKRHQDQRALARLPVETELAAQEGVQHSLMTSITDDCVNVTRIATLGLPVPVQRTEQLCN